MKNNKILLYSLFAIISTIINLISQRLILLISTNNLFFLLAIFIGTLNGLILKFYLDKKWIFSNTVKNTKRNIFQFSLYSLMGIITTLIFWGTETIFWLIWQNENMRELGAVLGLSLGYSIKYNLDKRFVFNQKKFRKI